VVGTEHRGNARRGPAFAAPLPRLSTFDFKLSTFVQAGRLPYGSAGTGLTFPPQMNAVTRGRGGFSSLMYSTIPGVGARPPLRFERSFRELICAPCDPDPEYASLRTLLPLAQRVPSRFQSTKLFQRNEV
jgi:hypothetical protein